MVKRLKLSAAQLEEVLAPQHTWGRLFMQAKLLAQPRSDYWPHRGHIVKLANLMATQGQIQPIEIVRYSRPDLAAEHLDLLRCYGEKAVVEDLRSDRLGRFSAVSFGHCRTLAHRVLWLYGCDVCRKEYGQERPGSCYKRHQAEVGLRYRVVYNDDPDPHQVVMRQFGENTARGVDPADEAPTIYGRWLMALKDDPELSIPQFSRAIGRAEVVVERAIGFAQAPKEVREAVDSDDITFTVGSELGRYHFLLVRLAEELESTPVEQSAELMEKAAAIRHRAHYLVAEYWLKRARVRRRGHALDSQMARVNERALPQDIFLRSLRNEVEQALRRQGSLLSELTPEEAERLTAQRQSEANWTLAGAIKAARKVLESLRGRELAERLDIIGRRLDPEVAKEFRLFIETLRDFQDDIQGASELVAVAEEMEVEPTLTMDLVA